MASGCVYLAVVCLFGSAITYRARAAAEHFTNEWAVHIPGGSRVARFVAIKHGYKIVREIKPLDDYYLLRHNDVLARSKRGADHHTRNLNQEPLVMWAKQQVIKIRVKRNILEEQKREDDSAYRKANFCDPQWPIQWYLHPKDPYQERFDLHVIPVWDRGLTGRGIVVTVLDDGLEHNHSDIRANYLGKRSIAGHFANKVSLGSLWYTRNVTYSDINYGKKWALEVKRYDPYGSTDLNNRDSDPMPRYDITNENKHGTRCAGEIAMQANNNHCGVGVAFNSKIGGVRMLDGTVTDSLEAEAIAFNYSYIDIYSASWGPNDDGKTTEGPGKLASKAFELGIEKGRKGKGVLYVWASGNGGIFKDDCNCDGYTGSIYTISINSATQDLASPWYAEKCPSTLATTYSSGDFGEAKVSTADLHGECTSSHTGTSAAAPLAAGVFALLLESNPDLTWRDVQHLVVWTSNPHPLIKNKGWKKNGAGLWVNNRFGFGILNAEEMVKLANRYFWKRVPEKVICKASTPSLFRSMKSGDEMVINVTTDGCKGEENEINYLEHLQIYLTMDYTNRGSLEIKLISPSNAVTSILTPRPLDNSKEGFKNWPFMSVHSWGESPNGTWKIVLNDKMKSALNHGHVKRVNIVMHGTKTQPNHVIMAGGKRKYVRENGMEISTLPEKQKKILKADLLQKISTSQPEMRTELSSTDYEFPVIPVIKSPKFIQQFIQLKTPHSALIKTKQLFKSDSFGKDVYVPLKKADGILQDHQFLLINDVQPIMTSTNLHQLSSKQVFPVFPDDPSLIHSTETGFHRQVLSTIQKNLIKKLLQLYDDSLV